MKEPMKYIIIAAVFLATTAHAKLPGIPSSNAVCKLAGAVYGAAYILNASGATKEEAIKLMGDAIKSSSRLGRLPPYGAALMDGAWNASTSNPSANADLEEQRMRAVCLED